MKGIYCIDDDPLITITLSYQLVSALPKETFIVEIENIPENLLPRMIEDAKYGVDPLICVVDFQMPGLLGNELTRLIKARFPETKIIMLSGNSNAMLVSDIEEEGLLEYYISKPWDKDDLLEKINKCLPLNLKLR